jgi:hypothetical protein
MKAGFYFFPWNITVERFLLNLCLKAYYLAEAFCARIVPENSPSPVDPMSFLIRNSHIILLFSAI